MLYAAIILGAFVIYKIGYFYGQDDERLKWCRWAEERQISADQLFWEPNQKTWNGEGK